MELRRSQREPKPRTIWEEKGAPSAAKDPKINKKTDRTEQKTVLKPVTTGPLPKTLKINENQLPKLSEYEPPLNLQFQRSKSLVTDLSQLDTFYRFLTPAIIDKIVESTNNYTENVRNTDFVEEEDSEFLFRPWKPIKITEI